MGMPSTTERWIVLLGAGASAEGGIPTSREMTRRMASHLATLQTAREPDFIGAFRFVCGQIIAHQSSEGADPFEDTPDVEEVFSAIELLAERRDLEISPFVAAWRPEVDAMERPAGKGNPHAVADVLERWSVDKARGLAARSYRVDDAIRSLIRSEVGLSGTPVYRPLLARMTIALRRLARVSEPEPFRYLDALFGLADRQPTLTIATLNYDRGLEARAEHLGREIDTGIGSWTKTGHVEWSLAPVRLLKLHGSVDWVWQEQGYAYNRLQRREVVVTTGGKDDQEPVVLFGQRGKLRAEGPFLDLLRAFAEALEEATHTVVVGYSFRDDHVNEYLRRWLSNDSARRLIIVDPNLPQPSQLAQRSPSFPDQLVALATPMVLPGQPAIEPQVRLVRKPASEALAEMLV
jgi:NAD-dependent SIR2 family protein deacetylase